MKLHTITTEAPVISWWSGGVTSAVTCKLCVDWFGADRVRIVFIDTKNEDQSTYRFIQECQQWYGKQIEIITNPDYQRIEQVWFESNSLNVATGAKCSQMLKRRTREKFEDENKFSYQAFGFDVNEIMRAKGMKLNNPRSLAIFPLISELLTKRDCVKIIQDARSLFLNINLPNTYHLGFHNNNCFQTGCVQGGIGYWQKMQRDFPEKFDKMALIEHQLTDRKGEPVTMLKDQGKKGGLVFLKPHPGYPGIKDISMMKGREPVPLTECNGWCGTNDLTERSKTEKEINYQE